VDEDGAFLDLLERVVLEVSLQKKNKHSKLSLARQWSRTDAMIV
jgi:hypothetical protein